MRSELIIHFTLLTALSTTLAGQTLLLTEPGDQTTDAMGAAVSGAGDLDGDGHPDFLAGAPQDTDSQKGTGFVRAFSGRTGSILRQFDGDDIGDRFGRSVAGGEDLDGDGIPDILVGAPGDDDKGTDAGSVRAFSGKDGTVLFTVHGSTAGDGFGAALAMVGDTTGDRRSEFVVGARDAGTTGKVWLLSSTGAVLFELTGKVTDKGFGTCVCGIGDVDGDGRPDFAIGAPGGGTYGYAALVSGTSGKILRVFGGPVGSFSTGAAVAPAGDVDRDGVPDLLVGAPGLRVAGIATGGAWVVSGADARSITSVSAGKSLDRYGTAVASPGDVDADGYPDLAIGALQSNAPARLFSGRTFKELFAVPRPKAAVYPGRVLAACGDVDQDGVPDLLLGDPDRSLNGTGGAAFVVSGTVLALATDVHAVRVKTTDQCLFTLDAGSAHAGKPYLLVGSATGTRPGIPLGSVHLPLNPDFYTDFLITNPNSIIQRSSGTLDSSGRASADFTVFSAIPHSAAGVTIWHGFIVFDSGRRSFDFASNARPLTFAKRW